MITKTQAAYLAGLLDGEGYFNPGTGTNAFGLRIQMINDGPLDAAHEIAGGWRSRGTLTAAGNRCGVWALQEKAQLRRVLKAVRPYLRLKGEEADKMLELVDHLDAMPRWDSRPSSALSPQQRAREGRREKRAAWCARREELREELKQLKHERR